VDSILLLSGAVVIINEALLVNHIE